MSISNYKTKNRIGVTDIVYLPDTNQSIEVSKQEVGLDDVFSGDSFYGKQMELEYEAWKDMNVDEDTKDITQEDYQMAALNTRAFGYESIRDTQENKEFWVNMGVLAVMIGATVLAVVVPVVGVPLALAMGALYGGIEAGSVISGKDWISGRELGTGERWFRGVLAPLDIIPGAAALKKFSGVARVTSFAGDLGKLGKTTAQSSIRKVNDLSIAAGKEAASRLKNAGAVIKERTLAAPTKLAEGVIGAGKVVDETFTNTKNVLSNLMPSPEFAFAGGAAKQTATNTHVVENTLRDVLSNIKGVNISDKGVNGADKLADLAKLNGKRYPDVELDEVIASGFGTGGKLKERWVVPKGFDSVEDFLKTVDNVNIKDYGYDSVDEFKQVVESVNKHLNGPPKNNIINKGLAGGTHVKGVDYDILGFPIFKGDDVKFTTKLGSGLLIATDDFQFKNCTNALRDTIERGEISKGLFTPKQLEQILDGEPRIHG